MALIQQKQPTFPSGSPLTFGTKPQPIIIPRATTDGTGVQMASIGGSVGTPSYITMNQLAPSSSTGTISVLANNGQVLQGTPFAFSQIQDFSQTGLYAYNVHI